MRVPSDNLQPAPGDQPSETAMAMAFATQQRLAQNEESKIPMATEQEAQDWETLIGKKPGETEQDILKRVPDNMEVFRWPGNPSFHSSICSARSESHHRNLKT